LERPPGPDPTESVGGPGAVHAAQPVSRAVGIERAVAEPSADRDANPGSLAERRADPDRNADRDADADPDPDPDRDADPDRNADADPDRDADADADPDPDRDASPDPDRGHLGRGRTCGA
jgi:hypothetical protein